MALAFTLLKVFLLAVSLLAVAMGLSLWLRGRPLFGLGQGLGQQRALPTGYVRAQGQGITALGTALTLGSMARMTDGRWSGSLSLANVVVLAFSMVLLVRAYRIYARG